MPPFSRGDRFVVTDPAAPFAGKVGTVTDIEADSPFPVVTEIELAGGPAPVSFKISEITPTRATVPVTEVTEMGT